MLYEVITRIVLIVMAAFLAAALAATPAMAQKKADPVDIQAAPDAGPPPEQETMVVTAEGLADPHSEAYKKDKGLLLDDLRRDAKAQILEKAVGSYVETSTLMENRNNFV